MGTTPTPQASAAPTPSEEAKMIPGYNPPTLPASTSASQEGLEAASPEATKTRWTIMVYIAADAVLANFGVESLKQLNEAAGSAPVPGDTASVVVAAQFSIDAP